LSARPLPIVPHPQHARFDALQELSLLLQFSAQLGVTRAKFPERTVRGQCLPQGCPRRDPEKPPGVIIQQGSCQQSSDHQDQRQHRAFYSLVARHLPG
jgi:hypothetical protein